MRNSLALASALAVTSGALATVEAKLYADTYTITAVLPDNDTFDGTRERTFSILDIYAKGSHLGDTTGGAVLGLITHDVVFRTSLGTSISDIFVQSGSVDNNWLPTDDNATSWDSFVALGNRGQGSKARVTNRSGQVVDLGDPNNWSVPESMKVPGSNYIPSGPGSGWYLKYPGGNAYSSSGSSENPFARVSLYNSNWNAAYGDLYRGADVLFTKGQMQTGRTTAAGAAVLAGAAGASLDFHWMIGRFAIDITDRVGQTITMQAQFNMVGKNGSGTNNETGTTFSGALTTGTNPQYKVSNHFTFAVPTPATGALLALAGLCVRRRREG